MNNRTRRPKTSTASTIRIPSHARRKAWSELPDSTPAEGTTEQDDCGESGPTPGRMARIRTKGSRPLNAHHGKADRDCRRRDHRVGDRVASDVGEDHRNTVLDQSAANEKFSGHAQGVSAETPG